MLNQPKPPTNGKQLEYALIAFVAFIVATAGPAVAAEGSGANSLLFLGNIFQSIQELLLQALTWVKDLGPLATVTFIGIYIIATVAFIPGSVLTLGAGFIFGVFQGSLVVFVGASVGATLAFLVGRYLARDWVAKKIEGNRSFAAIDKAVGKEGLKITLLLRLSPVFPFSLLNYALSLTGVKLKDYVVACLGMLPGTIMYVYFGSLASNLATIGAGETPSDPVLTWAIRIIGFIATVAVTVFVTRVARKALAESVPEAESVQTSS